jgi:hypothetical protein
MTPRRRHEIEKLLEDNDAPNALDDYAMSVSWDRNG